MNPISEIILIAGILVCVGSVYAQDSAYTVEQLNDHIYKLSYDAGGYDVKVIASAGPDGLLLVDTGDRAKAEDLKAALNTLGYPAPAYIILTHEHIEHIGGAASFGTDPTVIGHPSLRTVLKSRHFLFEEYTEATLPELPVDDTFSLHFNGEDIKVIAVPGAHSGSDLIVWFTGSEIACVAALCNWPHFPSIDNTTGDIRLYPGIVKRVIDLLPETTKIIPGHGSDCSMAEFRQFHQMLVRTRDIVLSGLSDGKTVETLQKENVLQNFQSYEGGYVSADAWIEYLAKSHQDRPTDARKSIFELMYHTLKEQGLEAAVAAYRAVARDHPDEYDLDDKSPAIIGYLLFQQGKYRDAAGFFQLSLDQYPEGQYANLSLTYLGRTSEMTGDIPRALECYRKTLETNPADTAIMKKIEELERK